MNSVVLAFASAFCFGAALVLSGVTLVTMKPAERPSP